MTDSPIFLRQEQRVLVVPKERLIPLRDLVQIWGRAGVISRVRMTPRGITAQGIAGLVLVALAVGFCLGLYFSPWLVPSLRPLQLVARQMPEPGSVLWLAEGE